MRAALVNLRSLGADGAVHRSPPPAAARVQQAVGRILESTPLCAWSTVVADGRAHVNIGYFAYSGDLHLYLLSHPASLHCRNLRVNPSMAVAVFESAQSWTGPDRGLQLFGTCAPVADAERPEAERIYAARYPAFAQWKRNLPAGDRTLEYRLYRFVPDRLKILDEAEFGEALFIVADVTAGA